MLKADNFDELIYKKDLVKLLDKDNKFDMQIFDSFDGNKFSKSNEYFNMHGLRPILELLIPNNNWTKKDYIRKYSDLSLQTTIPDEKNKNQLVLTVSDIEHSFITTNDSLGQLFEEMKMASYAKFMADDTQHLDLLKHNFHYWFEDKMSDKDIMIRTVKENSNYIARCFASTQYRAIDNHIVLYLAVWALLKLGVTFRLINPKVLHSYMKLDFLSEQETILEDIGKLSYGFTVINSESKNHQVEFHPICTLENTDGTVIDLIMDKPVTLKHQGRNAFSIIERLKLLNNIHDHLQRTIKLITFVKNQKVDEFLAYRIQRDIEQISKSAFKKFEKQYAEISSDNTLSLLQFFGRLNNISMEDHEKELQIRYLFWKTLKMKAGQ